MELNLEIKPGRIKQRKILNPEEIWILTEMETIEEV